MKRTKRVNHKKSFKKYLFLRNECVSLIICKVERIEAVKDTNYVCFAVLDWTIQWKHFQAFLFKLNEKS